MKQNNISIDEFYEKYQIKEEQIYEKYDFTAGHYSVEGDWSLDFKELHLDKYNIYEFKQLIKDYDNNRKYGEKSEICKHCERRKRIKEICKESDD